MVGMIGLDVARFIHLVAAAIWLGGLFTLAALVVALRKAGAHRGLLQAAARMFGKLSWSAMGVAVVTGVLQVMWMHLPWTYGRLHIKMGVVALAIVIAGVHQFTASRTGPAARGIIQLLIMLVSLGIFAAAVAL